MFYHFDSYQEGVRKLRRVNGLQEEETQVCQSVTELYKYGRTEAVVISHITRLVGSFQRVCELKLCETVRGGSTFYKTILSLHNLPLPLGTGLAALPKLYSLSGVKPLPFSHLIRKKMNSPTKMKCPSKKYTALRIFGFHPAADVR
jgi:hypothetical protein